MHQKVDHLRSKEINDESSIGREIDIRLAQIHFVLYEAETLTL